MDLAGCAGAHGARDWLVQWDPRDRLRTRRCIACTSIRMRSPPPPPSPLPPPPAPTRSGMCYNEPAVTSEDKEWDGTDTADVPGGRDAAAASVRGQPQPPTPRRPAAWPALSATGMPAMDAVAYGSSDV
jgi:hypothetical protein